MADAKFGRSYELIVETQTGGNIIVKPPFTVQFEVTRNVLSSANISSIRVLNLNANHRSQIRKNINDYDDIRRIQFKAGYGLNLPVVFDGNISQAWSVREGTDFVTQIESFDGGFAFANATSSLAFPAGAEQKTVIETLIGGLGSTGVKPGAIGAIPGQLSRSNAYVGGTCDILQELTGGRFFIDNGKAFVLGDNECTIGPITLINSASGLLGTPTREQSIIHFEMLFEPKLVIGQQVRLESTTTEKGSNVNGVHKVISLTHRGIISEAVCGSATTSVGLLQPLGSQGLTVVGAA